MVSQDLATPTREFLISKARLKFLAIAHYNFLNPNFARAAFAGISADADRVTGLDGTLGPSNPGQAIRTGKFSLPFLRRSGIVFGFPKNLHVWIDEIKSGHYALHRNRLVRIIVGRAVVRETRGRKGQNPEARGQKTHSNIFHVFSNPIESQISAKITAANNHRGSHLKTNYNARMFQKTPVRLRASERGEALEHVHIDTPNLQAYKASGECLLYRAT